MKLLKSGNLQLQVKVQTRGFAKGYVHKFYVNNIYLIYSLVLIITQDLQFCQIIHTSNSKSLFMAAIC